jgi:hypothetical protein
LVWAIHVAGQGEDGFAVDVFSARHGQAHAEQDRAVLRALHPLHNVLQRFERDAGLGFDLGADLQSLRQTAQRPSQFEIGTRLDLQKDVGGLGRLRLADVDQHGGPIFSPVREEFPLGIRLYRVKCRGGFRPDSLPRK